MSLDLKTIREARPHLARSHKVKGFLDRLLVYRGAIRAGARQEAQSTAADVDAAVYGVGGPATAASSSAGESLAGQSEWTIGHGPGAWQERLRSGGFWVLTGRVLGISLTLLSNVILARVLVPVDFGNFLLMTSIAGAGSVVAMFGLNIVMVKLVAESVGLGDPVRARQVFRLSARVGATSIALVGVVTPWALYYLMPQARAVPVVLVSLSLGIMLIAWQCVVAEGLRGLHEQRWASLLSGGQISGPLTSLLFIALVVALAIVRHVTFPDAVWLMDLALVITVVFSMYCLRRTMHARLGPPGHCPPPRHQPLALKDVVVLGAPLMIMQVLVFATSQADVWIAAMCCESDGVALYGVARRLATAVAMLPQIAGVAISAPIATLYAQGRLDQMQEMLRSSARLAMVPSVLACLALVAAGGSILELFFGSFYRQSAATLTVLVIGQVVAAGCGSCGYVLTMTGYQNVALAINLVATVLLMSVGPWAGSRFGMLGIGWTSTITLTAQMIVTWYLTRSLVGVWTHAGFRARGVSLR
jgi:O-antigen/teichoic acid export membrane protein